jgi:dihydropteroate synthase
MGIVNVNDDSFCGDGTVDPHQALAQARRLVAEGADCIDFGAESARTNREAIAVEEEVARLRPVLERWHQECSGTVPRDAHQVWPPLVSVNTWRTGVLEAVLPLGVDLANDMGGLEDPTHAALCAQWGASLLIMHTVGLPKVPHFQERYADVWQALLEFFDLRVRRAQSAGLPWERLVLDPGIDFAKQRDDNLRIYAQLERLTERYPCPVLLPISRKTVIGEVLALPDPLDRDAGSVACLVAGVRRGAKLFRVHDVKGMFEALKVVWAVEETRVSAGKEGRPPA